jgi:hypothetical protein
VRHAGIAIVSAGRLRVFPQGRQDTVGRFAGRFEHFRAEFTRVVVLAIMGLYGGVIGGDHCHRGFRAAEKPGTLLDAADTIGLVTGTLSYEHRGRGDELVEERRLGVGERCGTRLRRDDHREQCDG